MNTFQGRLAFTLCMSLWLSLPIATAAPTRMGDMILDDENMLNVSEAEGDVQGFAATDQSLLWENGVIPIKFAANFGSNPEGVRLRAYFMAGCAEWSAAAQIRCVPWSGQKNYAYVTRKEGCYSRIGAGSRFLGRDKRNINLGAGCWHPAIILHEIGHLLGFIHEHQRPDRNKFVRILWKNIPIEEWGQFTPSLFGKKETPYDFESIMHYSNTVFSEAPNKFSILPRKKYSVHRDSMGNSLHLTASDRAAVANLYGSP